MFYYDPASECSVITQPASKCSNINLPVSVLSLLLPPQSLRLVDLHLACMLTLTLTAAVDRMQNQINRLDWNDTFLNIDHLKASFPERQNISVIGPHSPDPPFR